MNQNSQKGHIYLCTQLDFLKDGCFGKKKSRGRDTLLQLASIP